MRRYNKQEYREKRESSEEEEENAAGGYSNHPAAGNVERNDLQRRRSEADSNRQPQYSGCFTMIPPNQRRRSENLAVAQRDEEIYQRWREQARVQSVYTTPQRLGGGASEAEARQNQLRDLRCSKVRNRLKKSEMDQLRRQEEEEKFQAMKNKQRQKAEENQRRAEEEQRRRREQYQEDQLRTNWAHFQQLEIRAGDRLASCGATQTSSGSVQRSTSMKEKKSDQEVELDRRRVNTAFLDKLEAGSRRKEEEEEEEEEELYLRPRPQQQHSESAGFPDPEPDEALTRLMSTFPIYSRDVLQEILEQCDGDYQQAFMLLVS
ncbi:unnamed protein product [Ophioblennius macclurei]